MIAGTKIIGQDWQLTEEEIDRFLLKAKEHDVHILRVPVKNERPLRATVNRASVSEEKYKEFALSVRPHHGSDV